MNTTAQGRLARMMAWIGSLAVVLAACSSPAATTPPASSSPAAASTNTGGAAAPTGTPIKVGVMDDVTGVGSIEGALMRISTELAVQRANNSGGVNGHPVVPVYVDPKG